MLISVLALTLLLPSPTPRVQDETSDALTQQASIALAEGKSEEAEKLFTEALRRQPGALNTHTSYGEMLLDLQRYPEAMEHFETVLKIHESDPRASKGEQVAGINLALQTRYTSNAIGALLCLEHARKFIPHDVPVLTALGVQAESMHRLREASDALNDALAWQPEDARALYALARVETDQQHLPSAEMHFRKYLVEHPEDASAHYGLGHLYQMEQRVDAASAEFQESLKLKPLQTESYYQLGQIALDLHRDAEARNYFETTLRRMETHGGALTGMGILSFRQKKYGEARQYLEAAVANSPDYQLAHYYLGLTCKRLDDTSASDRELRIATDLAKQQQGKAAPIASDGPRFP